MYSIFALVVLLAPGNDTINGKMEMMMIKFIIESICILILIQMIQCSLPDVVEPVEWKMHIEFPVADQKIPIHSILNQNPISDLPFDSSESGDTVMCIRSDTIDYVFEQQFGISDSTEFKHTIGACTIRNMAPADIVLQIANELPFKNLNEMKLSDDVNVSMSKKDLTIDGISYVVFDDSSPEMKISITNQTLECTMQDVVIALLDHNDVLAAIHIPYLSPGEKSVVTVPVAGKKIKSPAALALSVLIPGGTVVHLTDQVGISFSFNGLIISEAEIEDWFVDFCPTVSGIIPLSDSLKIEHIETGNAAVEINIWSPAHLKVRLSGSFYNSDNQEIFQFGHSEEYCDADGNSKSQSFEMFAGDTITALLDSCYNSFSVPLGAMKLFPGWDSQHVCSTLGCRFCFKLVPEGNKIRFKKDDQLVVKIRSSNIPLKRVDGRFLKKLEHSESTAVNSGLIAPTEELKRLQNALSLNSALLKFDLDPGLMDGCSIDSLLVQAVMKAVDFTNDSVVLTQTITEITSGSHHSAMMDFTGLFNRWPDTFNFDIKLLLPPGTGFSVSKMNREYEQLNPKIQFRPVLTWKVTVPLCWKVSNATYIEMEKTEIVLTEEQIENAKKIKSPSIKISLDLLNQTNINCRIYALGAVKEKMESLMEYPDSLISLQQFKMQINDGIFPVTGNDGIILAPRNGISLNEIVFDTRAISALLDDGQCVIRWFLFFDPGVTDALLSSDYFQVKATGVIEGTGNSDMLSKL